MHGVIGGVAPFVRHDQQDAPVRAAQARNIRFVMLNTNGKRIGRDDHFLDQLNEVRPAFYFQFDGFESETYRMIRGDPDLLDIKANFLAGVGPANRKFR